MHQFTRRKMTSHTARTAVLYASLFAAPGVAMAATGALSGRALPVALLLGVFLAAVAGYFASARALFQPPRTTTAPRAAAGAAVPGAC